MQPDSVTKIFSHIPTLHTERLVMRRMKPSDARDMYAYSCREDVTRYLLWEPHTSPQQTLDYLEYLQLRYKSGDFYDWGLICRADGHFIGTCGFTSLDVANNAAEIGYVLHPAYWGQGFAPEAVRQVLDFAFMRLNVHRVEARYMVGNERSRRVMEKCGMTYEGVRRSSMFVKGQYRDIGICSILSDEYIRKYL